MATASIPQSVLDKARDIAGRRAVRALKNIGDECVAEAVESGNYTDRTGNLRSSIGYVVAKDGRVVEEGGFWSLGSGDGPSVGRAKALAIAGGITGLGLVLVAGMQYATLVADRGYNVLDSAEILAKKLIAQLGG